MELLTKNERNWAVWSANNNTAVDANRMILRYDELVEELYKQGHALNKENKVFRQALCDITDPMAALKRHAEETGSSLNGYAYQVAKSPDFLQAFARAALQETR